MENLNNHTIKQDNYDDDVAIFMHFSSRCHFAILRVSLVYFTGVTWDFFHAYHQLCYGTSKAALFLNEEERYKEMGRTLNKTAKVFGRPNVLTDFRALGSQKVVLLVPGTVKFVCCIEILIMVTPHHR
jgi:hypothetical protein